MNMVTKIKNKVEARKAKVKIMDKNKQWLKLMRDKKSNDKTIRRKIWLIHNLEEKNTKI